MLGHRDGRLQTFHEIDHVLTRAFPRRLSLVDAAPGRRAVPAGRRRLVGAFREEEAGR